MRRPNSNPVPVLAAGMILALLIASPFGATALAAQSVQSSYKVDIFATGLNNPRGLVFGPDGDLYVAEGGTAGNLSTIGKCQQAMGAPSGVAPYVGGNTASVSKVSAEGVVTRVANNLPSTQWSPAFGSLIQGVSSVQFINGTLYGLTAGGGCSHGFLHTPNMVFKVNPDGSYRMVANLSAFLQAHPVAIPDNLNGSGDFEPDGTWYGMVAVGNSFYVTEPNTQQIDRVFVNGTVERTIDLSTIFVSPGGWQGATAITYHSGQLYFGTLGYLCCPAPQIGYQSVFALTPDGGLRSYVSNLTGIVGVAFDPQGGLYVLETTAISSAVNATGIGSGEVVRVGPNGHLQMIASNLNFPTGMAFGPDGNLYVSNNGYGAAPGGGEILRIDVGVGAFSTTTSSATAGSPSNQLFLYVVAAAALVVIIAVVALRTRKGRPS